jgi:tripartite ATP-independent transporter DctM subunit
MSMSLFFIVFVAFIGLNAPIAFAMFLCSLGFLVLSGTPLLILPERIAAGLNSYPLLAMPLFIIAARIMNSTGITRRIFDFCLAVVGHTRGGLAHVNVAASMVFAGISGSAMADVAGLGAIEIKAMIDEGYDPGYTAAITAASCTIGPVIPPSMIMILIGVMMEESVGRLFAGGFIPGVMMGLSLIIFIVIQAHMKKSHFPVPRKRVNSSQFRKALKEGFLPLLAPIIILGTILSGVATPTEAGIIAVVYAIILGVIYKELTFKNLFDVLKDGAIQTGVIMFIVAAAQIFSWIITTQRVAVVAYEFIQQFTTQKWVILLIINVFLLVVGCFIEGLAAIMITVPVLLPVIKELGVSPVHFGVFLCINILLGLLTPPLGIAVYISANVAKVSPMEVFKKSFPFLIPLLITLGLVTYIPELVTFIPNLIFR